MTIQAWYIHYAITTNSHYESRLAAVADLMERWYPKMPFEYQRLVSCLLVRGEINIKQIINYTTI